MKVEKKTIRLQIGNEREVCAELHLCEDTPNGMEVILINLMTDSEKISGNGDDLFTALQVLRGKLEDKNMQILCNGAAKIVYPSPMQMSMGSGRKAYKLTMGQQAKSVDIIDIFDCDEELEFASVKEQSKYYDEWLKSVMG